MKRSLLWLKCALTALVACSDAGTHVRESEHPLTANDLSLAWDYFVSYNGTGAGFATKITSDSDRAAVLAGAITARSTRCGASAACAQDASTRFRAVLCLANPDLTCNAQDLGPAVGWASLIARYETESGALVDYLEAHNLRATDVEQALEGISSLQNSLREAVEDAVAGKTDANHVFEAAHDRLAVMGAAATSAEQVHLADTRRIIARLDTMTLAYQAGLDRTQPAYGDIAARHASYRETEGTVFAAISQLATEASTADLVALASLKIQLAAQSDSENRTPQLLIVDSKRVLWELAYVQASYELGVAPYGAYLVEHSLPVLDHTSAPRDGMQNVIGYAEGRMRRVNDAVRTIYDGIRRRESALSLVAVEAATRDQIRAADSAARESEFLDEITARASAMWKLPPTGALGLQLQTERMTTMTAFLQLESVCQDLTGEATWRAPGCQKVTSEAAKVRAYLNQTLPFTLKFGVQKMRSAGGFDPEALADIEAKVGAGQLILAVHIYDATISTGFRS